MAVKGRNPGRRGEWAPAAKRSYQYDRYRNSRKYITAAMNDSFLTVQNKSELSGILRSRGVNVEAWGKQVAKTVGDLWRELCEGEARIHDEPFCRIVWVSEVLIERDGKVLCEVEQRLEGGYSRTPGFMPSEKIKTDESSEEAAARCLVEELELERHDILDLKHRGARETELMSSPAYPDLLCKYRISRVAAEVSSLPAEEFWTVERGGDNHDPVERHRWKWLPLEELRSEQ